LLSKSIFHPQFGMMTSVLFEAHVCISGSWLPKLFAY